jgi:hypothetical protein
VVSVFVGWPVEYTERGIAVLICLLIAQDDVAAPLPSQKDRYGVSLITHLLEQSAENEHSNNVLFASSEIQYIVSSLPPHLHAPTGNAPHLTSAPHLIEPHLRMCYSYGLMLG